MIVIYYLYLVMAKKSRICYKAKKRTSHIEHVILVRSKLECAHECAILLECGGFNFSLQPMQGRHQCQLFGTNVTIIESNLTDKEDSIYCELN